MAEEVLYEVREGVGRITLNRPDALNAWTPSFGESLGEKISAAAADPECRAVLVTGAGRAFSAGADVKGPRELTESGEPDLSSRLLEIYNPAILAIRELPKPVVAAVNGVAAGIGCSLVLACDLVLAAESSYLLWAFTKIGLAADGGSAFFLAERLGAARAAELMMLAERLPAAKARDWGLVNSVHPDDELDEAALDLCRRLAQGPTVAYGSIKSVLFANGQRALAEALELEARTQQRQGGTADFAEGVTAFKEKRRPKFRGR